MRTYRKPVDRDDVTRIAKEMMLAGQKRWEVREYVQGQVDDEALTAQIMKEAARQEGRESRREGNGILLAGLGMIGLGVLLSVLSFLGAALFGAASFPVASGLILAGIVTTLRGCGRSLFG